MQAETQRLCKRYIKIESVGPNALNEASFKKPGKQGRR